MYQLFIGNKNYSSWSLRPWLLMRALEIPFEEHLVPFAEHSSWTKFRDFSPNGLVPCLHDGSTVVWDSLAIAEFLAERHPGVWPEDAAARAWARCASAEMHSGYSALRNQCPMSCGVRVTLNEIGTALERDIARIDELWRDGLDRFGGTYLAGTAFTAVDAFFAPIAFRAQTYGLPLGDTAQQYADRILEHPAMQDWYTAGLAEPWREADHERDVAACGAVTADHRTSPGTGR
jgi:glutathione S-transferase